MNTEPPSEEKKKFPIGKLLIWVVVVAALLVGFKFLPIDQWWDSLSKWLDSIGIWGPIVFILIYAVLTVFLIPGSALTIGAGALFGLGWGSLWVIAGSNIGANLAFLIGRYLAREKVAKKIEGNKNFEAIDRAVAKEGWKIVGLTRLSPLFPFTLLNYAYGLTKVKWSHYSFASLIGMIPGTVMWVYIGSLGKLAAESDSASTVEIVFYGVGFLATVLVTVVITKAAKKALNEKADLPEEG